MSDRRITFATNVADELGKAGFLSTTSHEHKVAAAAAIHDELHLWAEEHFPMGCSAEMSEEHLKRGLKAVRNKLMHMPSEECEQKYGVPILLIISLIPTLVSWISMIWKLWKGE